MLVNFKHLILSNFMSFGYSEVDLNNQGFTLISGINNNPNDLAKSNGSGKSSIFESIFWCLTGDTLRGIKSVVNKFTTGGTYVDLTFDIDSNSYRLIRYKEHKDYGTNLKFYVNGEDKSGKGIRDTETIVAEYLPDLTAQLLGSVVILGQGLPQRFSNNTPSGRKEVLEKLSKSDYMIEDIKTKLSERKAYLNESLRKFEDAILSENSKKSIFENRLKSLKEDKALLVPVDYDAELLTYEKQLDLLQDNQIDAYNYSLQLNDQLNQKLKEYQDWTSKVSSNFEHEKTLLEETLEPYYHKMSSLRVELNLKEQEIARLESVVDVCPTCGQKLPDVHKVDTTNIKKERDALVDSLAYAEEAYGKVKESVDAKTKSIKESLDLETNKIKQEGQELRKLYNDVSKESDDYLKEINNIKLTIDKIKLNKENYEKRSSSIDNEIAQCENDIKSISDKILYNNIEKDNIVSHLEYVSKMMTCATRDFRGFLLSGIIEYLDRKAKEYSKCVFDTTDIEFKLDGNNIDITYLGKQYEALSGGEKQKIDLIVQFALRDMLCQYLGFSSNILVLDEIFDNLDEIGCQRILNLITLKLSDVDSIFIVTHHSDISIPYDKTLFVVKDEKGISKVV